MMWVESGNHRLAGGHLATILGPHAHCSTGTSQYPLDLHARQYLPAMILDATDERAGQAAATTDRHSETVRFQKSKKHVHAERGPFLIRRGEALCSDARKEQPHALMLESAAQQSVCAHLTDAPELASLARLIEHCRCRTQRNRRRVKCGGNHGEPGGRLFRNPAVRIRIGARELGDLRPGSLTVAIQGESLAVF